MNKKPLAALIIILYWPMVCMASSFDAAFQEVLPFCEQLFLPNSMAREPGSDINARLDDSEEQIDKRSAAFNSPDGKAYLKARIKSEKDDVALACIRHIQHFIGDGTQQDTSRDAPSATDANTETPNDELKKLTLIAGNEVHIGDTPEQISNFLKSHKFHYANYDRDTHLMLGVTFYDSNGVMAIPNNYSFSLSITFTFDGHNRLTDYDIDMEKSQVNSTQSDSEPEEDVPEKTTEEFSSPDKSCHLQYMGNEDSDEGKIFAVTNGKNKLVAKDYFRGGPDVEWISNSMASITVHEGVPAYHTYYYDCREHRVSPAYFMPLAFEPKTNTVATIEQESVVFYRLFSDKEILRTKAPDVGLTEYFGQCDSDARFESTGMLHVKMKCEGKKDIDVRIKAPD
jgi:hypothetical protein